MWRICKEVGHPGHDCIFPLKNEAMLFKSLSRKITLVTENTTPYPCLLTLLLCTRALRML